MATKMRKSVDNFNPIRLSDSTNARVKDLHGHRNSLFHDPQKMVAFAPSSDLVASEIDAIINLPSPSALRRGTDQNEAMKAKYHETAQHSFETNKSTSIPKQGKVPLPRPYKKHWATIEKRRAARDFIYGRDEEHDLSDRDALVKAPCCGVICFHALELLDLIVNKKSFTENVPVSYYCMLIIGQMKRCTKIVHAMDPNQIKMDNLIHLSVEISEWREAPNNRLRIEVWSFQDPEVHFIVGTVEIHLYHFIRLQHVIDMLTLWSDGIQVGKLAYEVAFSYGAFGYGHSNQLKNFSQPMMETISHSMFPRIKLDLKKDIVDIQFQARMPDRLKLFTYHSLILEMDDKNPNAFFGRQTNQLRRFNRIDLEPKPMVVQQVEFDQGFPVHCKLHMNIWQKVLQPDFNDMYGEYVCIGHKRARLDYLTNLVQGRMRDLFEQEASPLFQHLKQKELDIINQAEYNPSEIIHPKKVPCPYSQPFKIGVADNTFQNKFPVARRGPGYLPTVFGYTEPADKNNNPSKPRKDKDDLFFADERLALSTVDDDMEFLRTHKITTERKIKQKEGCNPAQWFRDMYYSLKLFFIKWFYYVFPEVQHELQIPEISVTQATPEGSTTNIYSYFTREATDLNSTKSKVSRLVKQTTALIEMSRKTHAHFESDSSTTSSSSELNEEEDLF